MLLGIQHTAISKTLTILQHGQINDKIISPSHWILFSDDSVCRHSDVNYLRMGGQKLYLLRYRSLLAHNTSLSQFQHISLSQLFAVFDNNNINKSLLSPWIFFFDDSACRRSNFFQITMARNIGGKNISGLAMWSKTYRGTWRKSKILPKSKGTTLRKISLF